MRRLRGMLRGGKGLGLLALLLLALPAQGQEPEAPAPIPAPGEPAPAAAPRAISVERVSQSAGELEDTLRRMLDEAPPQQRIEQIGADFADLQNGVSERVQRAQEALDSGAGIVALRDRRVLLGSVLTQLLAWAKELDRGSEKLGVAVEKLAGLEETWALTEAEVAATKELAGVESRVATSRHAVEDVSRRLRERLDQILALREQLLTVSSAVEGTIAAIDTVVEGGLLLSLKSRHPLVGSRGFRESLAEDLQAPSKIGPNLAQLRGYLEAEPGRFVETLLLFVAVCGLFLFARRRARLRGADHLGLHDARKAWEHPLAMAVLITSLLMPLLHPLSPPTLWRISNVLGFIAAIWILRAISDQRFDRGLAALVGLFLLEWVRRIEEPAVTLTRLLYLVELAATLALLVWFMRPARLRQLSPGEVGNPRFRLIGIAGRIAAVLLAVAIAVDLLGWHTAAELIGGGVLRAIYLGVILYAATSVASSVFAYGLTVRPFRLLRTVRRHRNPLRERADELLSWGGLALWAMLVLDAFGLWTPVKGLATAVLGAGASLGELAISVGDVLAFLVTLAGAYYFARAMTFVLEEEIFPRIQLPRGVPYALASLARYAVLFVGFLFALAASGFHLDRIAILAGGLGVGIGFGLQNIVNNFVSGLILLFERPLQVGDSVQLATESLFGRIRRIGIRASVIHTWDGSEVIVPNADLVSGIVTNWTLSDRHRRMHLPVGVAYGSDPHRMLALLLEVAAAEARVLDEPAPQALFVGFGDSSLDFLLRVWVRDFDEGLPTLSALALDVHDALREAGIEIPFPQRDVHVRTPPGS